MDTKLPWHAIPGSRARPYTPHSTPPRSMTWDAWPGRSEDRFAARLLKAEHALEQERMTVAQLRRELEGMHQQVESDGGGTAAGRPMSDNGRVTLH